MLREMGNRAIQMAFVFWIFVTLLFFMLHAAPGDITATLTLDPNLTAEDRRMMLERFGLDRPLHEQYVLYLRNLVTGDLGLSFLYYPRTVSDILWARLPRTIVLFTSATILSYWLGYVVGKIIAWKRGGMFEYGSTIVGVLLYTVFYPWFCIIMIWLFAFIFPFFPIRGFLTPARWRGSPYGATEVFNVMIYSTSALLLALTVLWIITRRIEEPQTSRIVAWAGGFVSIGIYAAFWFTTGMRPYAANIAHHSMLPTITLTLVSFAGVMLLMRTSMLETLREDYILTARAKGLPDRRVRDKHAARNALLPVVTTLVLSVAFIIGGGIVTETVFAWPGLGEAFLQASVQGDVPLALGCMVLIGVVALLAHLLVDVLYAYLDPRIRY